jgi:hypothetical protein
VNSSKQVEESDVSTYVVGTALKDTRAKMEECLHQAITSPGSPLREIKRNFVVTYSIDLRSFLSGFTRESKTESLRNRQQLKFTATM